MKASLIIKNKQTFLEKEKWTLQEVKPQQTGLYTHTFIYTASRLRYEMPWYREGGQIYWIDRKDMHPSAIIQHMSSHTWGIKRIWPSLTVYNEFALGEKGKEKNQE